MLEGPTKMRWCQCTRNNYYNQSTCNLNRKALEMKAREHELIKIDKYLKKRLEELTEAKANCKMTKKELAAVAKITEARKKLRQCEKTCKKHEKFLRKCKKRDKSNKRNKRKKKHATLHMFDRLFKMKKNINKLTNINRRDFMAALQRILLQPCSPGMRDAQGFRTSQRNWDKAAGDCYLMSLRKTPQLWLYHRWPEVYPHYLNTRAQWKNFKFFLMLCLGFIFWIPCLLCFALCKCCFCTCCCDNC